MKNNTILILKKVYLHLREGIPSIAFSIERVIKEFIDSIRNFIFTNIYFTGKKNSLLEFCLQNPDSISVLYSTNSLANAKSIKKNFTSFLKPFARRDLHTAIEMATYKHQIPEGLQQESQRLSAIINSMGCGVIVTDVNICIKTINPVAANLTGWEKGEAIGKQLSEVFFLKDAGTQKEIDNKNLVTRVIENSEDLRWQESYQLVKKNEEKISIGLTVSPMRYEDEEILGAVLVFQDISQRKEMEAKLIQNAFYDSITGLPNRVLFIDKLTQAFERGKQKNNYCFSVLFLDLDGFKGINDKFGHGMGDKLLVDISQRLKSSLFINNTFARFGGDEFAVLLEDIASLDDATKVAQRILESLKNPFDINGYKTFITTSIGIALSDLSHKKPLNLLDEADRAMYEAKQEGKARYKVFRR